MNPLFRPLKDKFASHQADLKAASRHLTTFAEQVQSQR